MMLVFVEILEFKGTEDLYKRESRAIREGDR